MQFETKEIPETAQEATRDLSSQVAIHARAVVSKEVVVVPYDGSEPASMTVEVGQPSEFRSNLVA